jgi:hypothetical protein
LSPSLEEEEIMAHRTIPQSAYGGVPMPSFEGFSDAQFREALESGAAHYANWQHTILTAQEEAKAAVAGAAHERRLSTAQRPADEELSEKGMGMQPDG